MEKKRIDFAVLKRMAPGPFSEQMLDALSRIDVDEMRIEISSIELGDDPVTEKLNVTYFVEDTTKRMRFKGQPPGPKLFFTFTGGASTEENLIEFRKFVKDHARTASRPPRADALAGHVGD